MPADLPLEEFLRPIDGFLRTLFVTSKAVARHMGHGRPGVILTLSEPGAKLAIGGILGDGVSAAGKEAFSRLLAAELAPPASGSSASVRTPSSTHRQRVPTPRASSRGPRRRPGGRSRSSSRTGWRKGTLLKRLPHPLRDRGDGRVPGFGSRRVHGRNRRHLSGGALVD